VGQNTWPKEFTPRTIQHIQCSARRLAGLPGFSWTDCEDIEQELALAVWKSLPRFDPNRASLDTFVDRVIGALVSNAARNRERDRRDYRRQSYSIDRAMRGGFLTAEQRDFRTDRGCEDLDPAADGGLVDEDVQSVVAVLPPDLREIAEMLMSGMSLRAIARKKGCALASLQENELHRMRRAFEKMLGISGQSAPDGASDMCRRK
jgi:DNA-directed RNA polymerase specialized sigma24 family protein